MPTAIELRELDDEELEGRLAEYRRELLNLRFQLATGQLDNSTRLAIVRKDVARVLTILRDREIALAEGRPAGPVVLGRPARRRPEDDDTADAPAPRRARRTRAAAAPAVEDEVDAVDGAADDVALEDADELADEDVDDVADEADDTADGTVDDEPDEEDR